MKSTPFFPAGLCVCVSACVCVGEGGGGYVAVIVLRVSCELNSLKKDKKDVAFKLGGESLGLTGLKFS